jgi:hypothetical protein
MGGQPVERLRAYLGQLSPAARAMLAAEIERGALRGQRIPGGDLILQELRRAARERGERRFDHAARLFFDPLEPFMVDGEETQKPFGRVARSSLEPIWAWIGRDLLPEQAATYSDDVGAALVAGDAATSARLINAFQGLVAERIAAALAAGADDEKARGRLAGQIGTPSAIEDVRDLHAILEAREALAALNERLPGAIQSFAGGQVDAVKTLLDAHVPRGSATVPYALLLVARRLASPWQIIRVPIRATQSDDAARVVQSPYGVAVTIVLGDLERMVRTVKAELKRGGSAAVATTLKRIHDAARGLRTELDFPADSNWGRQLAAIRAEISSVLETQIDAAPGRVRRLLRPRPAREIVAGSTLDAGDVADTEGLVELVNACRYFASDLAISEVTTRSCQELEQYLDTGTQGLIDALRAAGPGEYPFRQSQVQAAIRFCAKLFGQEYATLLTKAAEVAAQRDRKVAVPG